MVRREIVLLVIDPFLQSHTANENDNAEMGFVMDLWCQVASRANCAVWLIHHFRKGGQGGDAESFRGAGVIQGSTRAMSTMAAMSLEEGDKLGIDPMRRKWFIRKDDAKANMSPPAELAEWFELVSVAIGNATDDYPEGDNVQVIRPWEPPTPWAGLSFAAIARMLQQIETGPSPGERYSASKQAKARWAGRVLIDEAGRTESQATSIIKAWIDTGLLEKAEYKSPSQDHHAVQCVTVNLVKAAEMRTQAGTFTPD